MDAASRTRAATIAIGAIWACAGLGAVVIGLAVEQPRQVTAVTVLMLALFLVSGVLQLGLAPTSGFIRRMTLSTVGALAILAIASLIMGALGAEGRVLLA